MALVETTSPGLSGAACAGAKISSAKIPAIGQRMSPPTSPSRRRGVEQRLAVFSWAVFVKVVAGTCAKSGKPLTKATRNGHLLAAMSEDIPFDKELNLVPDRADEVLPGVRRVMANNPG